MRVNTDIDVCHSRADCAACGPTLTPKSAASPMKPSRADGSLTAWRRRVPEVPNAFVAATAFCVGSSMAAMAAMVSRKIVSESLNAPVISSRTDTPSFLNPSSASFEPLPTAAMRAV